MDSCQTDRQDELLTLPNDAPRIRITAGVGTASQKSWYLRRPVTLIGSRRRAHIVLHGAGVARAHCAIVNTGSAVLLKDLHTPTGTLCNNKPVDLVLLRDGDLVQIGSTLIQVAIQTFRSAARHDLAADADPLKLSTPLRLQRSGEVQGWMIDSTCAVIGSAAGVAVRLEHEAVSLAHALLLELSGRTVLFDLASESGTLHNGQPIGLAPLERGDHLRVGPFELTALAPDDQLAPPTAEAVKLALMGEDLRGTWHEINDWHAAGPEGQDRPESWEQRLAARAADLDRLDASLRGRLHDLTGHQEDLAAREKDLAGQLEGLKVAQARLFQRVAEIEQCEAALATREKQLAEQERRLKDRPPMPC